ncbi:MULTISPECIES: hypothetical protein [unclassified Microbacterium]|nr:hypothetical protein [Microbacterium sp. B24]
MKDILIEGHRILTTDDVADAVLTYAQRLNQAGSTDIVEFPSIDDGALSVCRMLLGSGIPVAVLDATTSLASDILGADRACAEISRRTAALASGSSRSGRALL